MKSYDKIIALFLLAFAVITGAANIFLHMNNTNNTGLFKVEVNRVVQELENGNEVALDNYQTIADVSDDQNDRLFNSEDLYVIREVNGRLYRIEYKEDIQSSGVLFHANVILLLIFLITLGVLLYIRQTIIRPFHKISEFPYMLAKGNLNLPLKETKSRYFGKFIWGLDMLREELERSRQQELERAKREKTAMLSISHDIKTPLAAIKLYAKAIADNLYSDEEKQRTSAENINIKADEIERYVRELTSKLNSDFMVFHTEPEEVYLSFVLNRIKAYYSEKLRSLGTDLVIENYTNCLLFCDPERIEEVLQNIMENAIKYGDGKTIRIDISEEEDCILITVSNSGCTLPSTELSHIFDSFWRGSNVGNQGGNGLGLYICRRLMNEMNGDIFAQIRNDTMCVTVVCHKFS